MATLAIAQQGRCGPNGVMRGQCIIGGDDMRRDFAAGGGEMRQCVAYWVHGVYAGTVAGWCR